MFSAFSVGLMLAEADLKLFCPALISSDWFVFSYKGLVAEALRQLVGEHNYKQDEVLAPGYYTGTTP